MSLEITKNTSRSLTIFGATFEDDTLLATGVATWEAGTLLGRITASGKLTPYAAGASDGSQVPVTFMPVDVTFTGAGDYPIRVPVAGRFRRGDLKVGIGAGTALTQAQVDALRDYSLIALNTTELSELDNGAV